jgi:hypothetical protein
VSLKSSLVLLLILLGHISTFGQVLSNGLAPNRISQSPLGLRISDGDLSSILGTFQFKTTTVTLTANATNYIYLDLTTSPPALTVNTTGFPSTSCYKIAAAITNGRTITSLTDSRPSFNSTLSGASASTHLAGIQYVSPLGSDANDGLTWGTAKLTIFAALEALPGGSATPPKRGNGTVYFADGARANPMANAGIWLMNYSDPNYSSPPAGWLQEDVHQGPLRIVGIGCRSMTANHAGGAVCTLNSGGTADTHHPAIWISGAYPEYFENMSLTAGVGIRGGVDSRGNRSSGVSFVNKHFENIAIIVPNTAGLGPAVDIGSNSFNDFFNHMGGSADSANVYPIASVRSSGLVRSSGVTTVKTTATNMLVTGQNCGVTGAADTSFNGLFLNITVTSGKTFTVAGTQASLPNATSGGGYVVCDNAAYMVMDGASGAIDTSLIYIANSEFNGGGIVFHCGGNSSGGFTVEHIYTENSYAPTVWATVCNGDTVTLNDIQFADPLGDVLANVRNDGTVPWTVTAAGPYVGPFIAGAETPNPLHPYLQGQNGIINGFLRAPTMVAASAPQSVRYANTAPTNPASWTLQYSGHGTLKPNTSDRDGGTNAATVTGASGGLNYIHFVDHPSFGALGAGDWVICAAFLQSSVGYNSQIVPRNPIYCEPENTGGYTFSKLISSSGPSGGNSGEWEWNSLAFKIGSISGGDAIFEVGYTSSGSATPISAYAPVLIRIPAGTLSDSEVMDVLQNLHGYLNTCSAGQLCDAVGQVVHTDTGTCTMSSGTCGNQNLSHTWAAAPKCTATWTGAGTLAGSIKIKSSTTTVTPASSNGTDTAQVNWVCVGN